ncbi:DinB family protein [Pedobacter sandarakinus]|uniref:DinB family protein n=1 Tax=Pedobacter sandarakinus TaxID=353156 RepID=UPI0022481B33|nr:DinB family protein [Pedobacter sandarakinus]MCX2576013.1 DinB family protein [Pedobacter sandarakinus]
MGKEITIILKQQYEYIQYARNTVLEYLKTISDEDLTLENSSFGRGSIRNLLVHICDTYAAWIGKRALGMDLAFLPFNNYTNIEMCIDYFKQIDGYMFKFLEVFASDYEKEILIDRNVGQVLKLSPLRLFSHVITHEFHHKGQIMSLSRHLGYIPVDADIIR